MAKFLYGLNLRTDRLAASLAKVDKHKIDEVASSYCLSRGVDIKGVTNISILIDSLKDVTQQVKSSFSDVKVNSVFVSLDSVFIKKTVSSASVPLLERGNKIINSSDIKKLTATARAFAQRLDEEIIYHFPIEFIVDDQIVTKNPLGLYAHKLEVKLLCLLSSRNLLDNITYAFRCAGFDIASFMYSPLSLSLNIDQDKKDSCVVVDCGNFSTDILLFKDGVLEDIEILDVGSYDVTKALAREFNVSLELAQELRNNHSILDADSIADDEILLRKSESYQPIKRSDLVRVILSSFSQQFAKIKEALIKYKHFPSTSNLFIAGDDVLLDGFLEIFSKEINVNLEMIPLSNDIKSRYKGHPHLYCSSLGAIKFAISDSKKKGPLPLRGKNIMRKGLTYAKELYQEYF